ncbi:FecR domain-containing protein [Sphingobacterium oryzagri]|uniref:FecR domain-containing protein n=1 Tax=Sphingobacterium oryzagri TaxID=3025669 RepID=A0ABY7WKM5_9SPHI|nr:FecR family protein [Sphingobacterium sp. KACC 22765]WDF69011.1 FecR domain-containing protein [Sphingobacterium sp. KACC 22765]
MKFKKLKQLLNHFDSDKLSAAERRVIDIWYASFSQKKTAIPMLDDARQKEALRRRIWEQLPLNQIPTTFYQRHKKWLYSVAAAAVLLLVGVWFYRQHEAVDATKSLVTVKQEPYRSRTGDQERKQIMLPDSSQVWLNANSEIVIAGDYGKGSRRVQLDGEAFFDIKPDSSSPFVVETDPLDIEVLGTAFNVSTYRKLARAQVVVDHGTVAVRDRNHKLLEKLTKGQSLHYHIADQKVTLGQVREVATWRKGSIKLEQATFDELAQAVKNVYGIQLRSERTGPKSYSYNLHVHSDRSLEQTMAIITRMHRLNYRRENNAIILY